MTFQVVLLTSRLFPPFLSGTSGPSWDAGSPRNVQLPQRSKHSHANTPLRLISPHSPGVFYFICTLTLLSPPPPLLSADGVSDPPQTPLQNGCECPSFRDKARLSKCTHSFLSHVRYKPPSFGIDLCSSLPLPHSGLNVNR